MNIQPADLRAAINDILGEYTEEVDEATSKAVEETAKQAVKELKTNPVKFKDRTYSKGWTKKVTRHRLYTEAVVYNRTEGHLTHLLEFGHVKRGGGRTTAYPHIAPVNDKVPDLFQDNFTEALNN